MKSSYWPIENLPGINDAEQAILKSKGINDTEQLLKIHRSTVFTELEINEHYLNKWIALADLARVPSVGYIYCGVLLHAGVCSVDQLTQMTADRLHRQVLRLQVATTHSRKACPAVGTIQTWIQQARELENGGAGGKSRQLSPNYV